MKSLLSIKKIPLHLFLFFTLLSVGKEAQASGKWTMTVTISGNTTVCPGNSVSFNAVVSNYVGTLTYQWRKNGSNITGITGPPPYVLALNSANNGDVFTCVVTSTGSGTATSNSLTLTVTSAQPFTASANPNNIFFCQGAAVTFTASSAQPLTSYQWQMNGSNVAGATSSTFSTTASSNVQLQSVRVLVTTNAGCVSNTSATGSAATIPFVVNPTVTPSISISSNAGASICSGASVTFTATSVNGGSPPGYQWKINGAPVSGATASTYTTTGLTNGQQVTCVLTSNASCATATTVTSNTITMTVNTSQTMTATIGGSTSICQGSSTSLSVNMTNSSGNLSFQWKKNGVNITGIAGPPPYVLVTSSVSNNDVFSCVVTSDNPCVSPVTSNSVTVTINAAQPFTASPNPNTIYFCQGAPVTFTAGASQTPTSYQWLMNGNPISGATSNTYNTTASSVAQLQSIGVTVTTSSGACISNTTATGYATNIPFVVTPVTTPSISISASAGNTICSGTAVTFTATPVNAGSTPGYQWLLNGTPIPLATGSTYTTSALTDGQSLSCQVTSNSSCISSNTATSNAITMTVNASTTMGLTIGGPASFCQGSEAGFSATATNYSGSLTFHWMKNGNPITSDVNGPPPYVLVTSTLNNNDVITCQVTEDNGCASPVTSNSVVAVVTAKQTFSAFPSPPTIYFCQDQPVTFTVSANFPTTGTYQWQMNGQSVFGVSGNTFTTTASSVAQLQSVTVTATAASGCISNTTSTASDATVPFVINQINTPSVSFTQSPIPVVKGSPVTFTAVPVAGGFGPTYKWKLNGVEVPGVTGGTYTPTITTGADIQTVSVALTSSTACSVNPANSGDYYVQIASSYWENMNYLRIHDILVPGVMDWVAADNLPIGQKQQTTNYMDGLGRVIQKVGREAATPASGAGQWQDWVQPIVYDGDGRTPKQYLPYTTTTELTKYKTTSLTEQASYYTAQYNESPAYGQTTYDNTPLNRLTNGKEPGSVWAAGAGNSIGYTLNDQVTDNVQMWSVGYNSTDYPVSSGAYLSNTLFKNVYTDDKNKQIIEYTNNTGQLILKKTQLDDNPAGPQAGWICTYNVYDDYGQIRFVIQPEAVKYLDANNWSFSGTDGPTVLGELCSRYEYDQKGRTTLKKIPGSKELYLVYDNRDRVVFTQDGNQRSAPVQWQTTLYDEMDRTVVSALYITSKTQANLQSDAAGAAAVNTTITTPDATITVYDNPVAPTDLSDPSKCTTLHYDFYDDYNYNGAKPFNNSFINGQAYSNTDPTVMAIVQSGRTTGLLTGTKTRVLGTSNFLYSTVYYDEKGRSIQTLSDNITTGVDVATRQYHFDGRVLSNDVNHTAAGTLYTNYHTLTKQVYDQATRKISVQKMFGANPFTEIAQYSYDDMGRMSSRRLAPGYTGNGGNEMELLTYSYNLHGNLTGINKDYALKTPGQYDKWAHFFGMYLGYENSDGLFAHSRQDGHITGTLWNTRGDDAQRKYEYDYDNDGRLINAAFTQRQNTGDAWDNAKIDFSVTGYNGKIEYDLDGNIGTMLQKGVAPGQAAPLILDDLRYSYVPYSNRLAKVYDNGNAGLLNGKLGDFKDGSNGGSTSGDDYTYDDNGNMIKDLNKEIRDLDVAGGKGISYNCLDKPERVRIAGKGIAQFVYDGNGNKLQKIFTPDGGTATTTNYINEFIYQDNVLQYMNFEEGRVRVMQFVNDNNNNLDLLNIDGNMDLPGGKRGAIDYFIKDHLGNVRMVLTEETHSGRNICTMETGRYLIEEPLFGQVDANGNPTPNNEVKARFLTTSIPGQLSGNGWTDATIGDYVSRLSDLTSKIGPNSLLKVMSGDLISAQALYYYAAPVSNDAGGSTIVNDLLLSLGSAITGSGVTNALTKGATADITGSLSSASPFTDIIKHDPAGETIPRAYLYVLFFDERFNFIPEGSTSLRVSQSGNGAAPLSIPNVKAPKNGYAYIYVGNESDAMVYFDNLQVSHNHGPILEENHYYAFGLKMAGISSVKLADTREGRTANNYQYQGEYDEFDSDLGWNDFELRSYDPQIGRFLQQDPYDQYASPYIGMGNDPAGNFDEDGGFSGGGGFAGAIIGAVVGFAVPYVVEWISGKHIKDKGLIGLGGAFIGAGIGYATGETLFPVVGYEANFADNFVAFYKGLLVGGGGDRDIVKLHTSACGPNTVGARVPDVWGWIGQISLPSLDFLKPPIIPPYTEIALNIFFHANESRLDDDRNKESNINKQIRSIRRTLKKDPDTKFTISGGIRSGNPDDIVGPPQDPNRQKGDNYYYKGKKARELARDRAERAKEYIQKRLGRKYRNRINTDDQIIPGDYRASGRTN